MAHFGGVLRVSVHDTLFEVASDGKLVPSVATGAEANENATEWRMTIKKGITFHNGQTLTPEDVVNSIAIHLGPDTKSPVKSTMTALESYAVDGDDVVFKLNQPDADWPAVFADYNLSIMPTKDGVADWQSGIGCGPYKLLEFEPGAGAKLERNENDHRSDRGWFDSVELIAVNDGAARVNAILTGAAHVVAEVDTSVAQRVGTAPNIKLVSRTSPGFNLFDMQTAQAPFNDNNVRLALKYAIQRDEFVDKILNGFGTVANDNPIGPSYRFHDASIEQHSYDPDRARYHLKQAGLDSINVELSVSDSAFEGSVSAAQLYSESAKTAGINLVPKRVPADGYWAEVWGKDPFFASYWTGRPTEALIISLAFGTGAAWNATSFSSERLDNIVTQAKGERDEAKRAELYSEAQRILTDEGPSIIPAFYNVVDAVSDKIGTPEATASPSSLDGRYAVSRWWFN
ncbi:ABC transporter substrate-binding protein [Defluviimonas sp. SAOS-178_SWC]|uniref:ABC transporter substrate-binding protein n=1 Tax=Defluviimonas sp. SAOS-178_SWC TaxID=3121287 RepID=UPI0032215481